MNNTELLNKIKGFPLNNKQKLDLLDAISEVVNRILYIDSDNPDNPDNDDNNDNTNDKYICFKIKYISDTSPLYKDIQCTIPYNGELIFATDYYYIVSSKELLGVSLKEVYGISFNNIDNVELLYNLFKNYKVIVVDDVPGTLGASIYYFSGINSNPDSYSIIFTLSLQLGNNDIKLDYNMETDNFEIYVPSPMESPV